MARTERIIGKIVGTIIGVFLCLIVIFLLMLGVKNLWLMLF